MVGRPKVPATLACWSVVFGVLLLTALARGGALWTQPLAEASDYAVNALYIRQAQAFAQTTGNYSRFHFHHPGPFFFYLYGAGETLLGRGLPAPLNAHLWTMTLWQCAALALAIAVASSREPGPVFPALATGAALLSFPSWETWHTLWPPFQFLGTFLLALVTAAWVGAGATYWLPVFTLAACICLHAHVGQMLFMPWLFALAARGLRGRPLPRRELASSALILALFSFPAAWDALHGFPNGRAILAQLRASSTTNPWDRVVRYQLEFSGRAYQWWKEPEGTPAAYLQEHPLAVAWSWGLAWLAIPLALRRREPGDEPWRNLAGVALGALALSWLWALGMPGGLHPFNSFFLYAIQYLPVLLWCRLLARAGLRLRLAALVLLSAAALVSVGREPPVDPDVQFDCFPYLSSPGWQRWLEVRALQGTEVYLDFPGELWPQAAALALGLERAGVRTWVAANWRFMFGARHDVSERHSAVPLQSWRLLKVDRFQVFPGGVTVPLANRGGAPYLAVKLY